MSADLVGEARLVSHVWGDASLEPAAGGWWWVAVAQ